jgi:hypothetical protein
MIDLFERALQFGRDDPAEEKLRKLEAALGGAGGGRQGASSRGAP